MPWEDHANCAGRTDLLYPTTRLEAYKAEALCNGCVVRVPCRDDTYRREDKGEVFVGWRAGISPWERRSLNVSPDGGRNRVHTGAVDVNVHETGWVVVDAAGVPVDAGSF